MLPNILFISSLLCLILSPLNVLAARPHEFKLCHQSSFCRRLRGIADRANDSGFHSPYSLGTGEVTKLGAGAFGAGEGLTVGGEKASWTFPLQTELYPEVGFELRVDFIAGSGPTAGSADAIARIRVDEVGSKTAWKRYNEASKWALVNPNPELADRSAVKIKESTSSAVFTYGEGGRFTLEVEKQPFKVTFKQDGVITMAINDRKLFHMEHFRLQEDELVTPVVEGGDDVKVKVEEGAETEGEQKFLAAPGLTEGEEKKRAAAWFEGDLDIERWKESWKQWHDAKPKGPEGFAFDVSFPGSQHIYGLAEHASPLSLRATDGSEEGAFHEPYRMWNVDIFEYDADSPMALYGAIPMVHAQNTKSSVGLLNLVASETLVDVKRPASGVQTHWISESGIMDLFILPGPSPNHLFSQYASLTGTTPLPPLWSIAYHQCRWNYLDTHDVLDVQKRFDEEDIPLDVTWLDIEYAEEHRYFDWDKKQFPDPVKMQEEVGAMGRKMVAIVDPHIKKTDSFRVYKDAQEKDIIVKRNDKTSNFNGWCWTGDSVWVDFFNPKSWSWWKEMFSFKVWTDSTKFLHIWNDMNEPSVFDGPEISMPRDNIHQDGWEHRDVHNINGLTFQKATFEAMVERESPAKRPFVLSRSFYPGSQRYGAIWTGDNMGTWDHFSGQTAMLLSLGICGMNFAGADVGGFFGNPSTEMLVRWYQAGAFMPFFRAHAHIDTKRREPYLYDEPYKGMMRDIIRMRYQMLPLWYTAFQETETTGAPIMRSQHAMFPHDAEGFGIDDQYYVGSSGLLVKPITRPGLDSAEMYLSDNQPYYNYFSNNLYPASKKSRRVKVPAPLETVPLLIQGGSILPIRSRVRRASTLMWRDPFTLIIAVGVDGSASGRLYLDDGDSYDYKNGQSLLREFNLQSSGRAATLSSKNIVSAASSSSSASTSLSTGTWATGISTVRIEQVIILGLSSQPKSVHAGGVELDFTWEAGVAASSSKEGVASRLVVKDPKVKVVEDWEIVIA